MDNDLQKLIPNSGAQEVHQHPSPSVDCDDGDLTSIINGDALEDTTSPLDASYILGSMQKGKRSSFQITRVVSKEGYDDPESTDDCRDDTTTGTEEFSSDLIDLSNFTIEIPDSEDTVYSLSPVDDVGSPVPQFFRSASQPPDRDFQSRFRLVKIEVNKLAGKRGRWSFVDVPVVDVPFSSSNYCNGTAASTDTLVSLADESNPLPVYPQPCNEVAMLGIDSTMIEADDHHPGILLDVENSNERGISAASTVVPEGYADNNDLCSIPISPVLVTDNSLPQQQELNDLCLLENEMSSADGAPLTSLTLSSDFQTAANNMVGCSGSASLSRAVGIESDCSLSGVSLGIKLDGVGGTRLMCLSPQMFEMNAILTPASSSAQDMNER